jgi:hypothetical protein
MEADSGSTSHDFMVEMERRLEEAGERTRTIYMHVGYLCTTFSGLETELLQLTARLLDPVSPKKEEAKLSKISFANLVKEFATALSSHIKTPEVVANCAGMDDRLRRVARERNEIVHSSWVAYTSGDYGQNRARLAGDAVTWAQVHDESPIVRIDAAIEEAKQLLWGLIGLDDLESASNA